MLHYFYVLLLVSRVRGHIVDCSDFCATYWDLPLVQERLQGEMAFVAKMGFPGYKVRIRFAFDTAMNLTKFSNNSCSQLGS